MFNKCYYKGMLVTEITIAVLLGILVIVSSIYLTYFSINNFKKLKERKESGDEIEESSKGKRALSICLIAYLMVSIFIFATSITYKTSPYINGQYYVSVNSNSMSAPLASNTYLDFNKLKNQIKQYDIAVIDKYVDQEIKQYDIILFKKNNKYIIHRVIEIKDSGTYQTQGDFNERKDDFLVNKDEIIGIYNHSLKFMSFINYLGYTPGFYILMIGVTYDIGVLLFFEYKREILKRS